MDKTKILKLRRGKLGLFIGGHKFGTAHEVDVAIILRKNGQYYTYRSLNNTGMLVVVKVVYLTEGGG